MAVGSSPVVAETPETGQRYRRLRAFDIAVGVLLAAEVVYIVLSFTARSLLARLIFASVVRT